jgi:hypothetical protein
MESRPHRRPRWTRGLWSCRAVFLCGGAPGASDSLSTKRPGARLTRQGQDRDNSPRANACFGRPWVGPNSAVSARCLLGGFETD